MDFDEAEEILAESFDGHKDVAEQIIKNTLLIQNKIEEYSLERKQIVPKVKVPEYDKYDIMEQVPGLIMEDFDFRWPTLRRLLNEAIFKKNIG